MAEIANLADLYEAVFQEPPSAMTRGSLVAMAHAFRITDNDPLGPVIVMSMRSTDLSAAALQARSEAEQTHREKLRQLTGELGGLLDELARARNQRWWNRPRPQSPDCHVPAVRIAIDRHASPLVSYLGHAFLRRNGVDDRDERIAVARFDLFLFGGFALLCAGMGAGLLKAIGGA